MKLKLALAALAPLALPATALAQEAAASAAVTASPAQLAMRWLHILGAAALLGAGIFTRTVLAPAAASLPAEAHDQLRAAVRARWSKVLMLLITILLVSGFVNYLVYAIPAHKGQGQYHMLMGIKIILAFGVFFLGSLLAGRTSLAQKLQANNGLWLAVTVLLGTIITVIAGYLKFMPTVN